MVNVTRILLTSSKTGMRKVVTPNEPVKVSNLNEYRKKIKSLADKDLKQRSKALKDKTIDNQIIICYYKHRIEKIQEQISIKNYHQALKFLQ